MSKGILKRPTDDDLDYTFEYICRHPSYLKCLDQEALRLLHNWIIKKLKSNTHKTKNINEKFEYWLKKIDKKLRENDQELALDLTSDKHSDHVKGYFFESFRNDSFYYLYIEYLSKEKYINPSSLYWIDRRKGYKSTFVGSIKALYPKGYTWDNYPIKYIQAIAKHCFHLSLSVDTIKHTVPSGFASTFKSADIAKRTG